MQGVSGSDASAVVVVNLGLCVGSVVWCDLCNTTVGYLKCRDISKIVKNGSCAPVTLGWPVCWCGCVVSYCKR